MMLGGGQLKKISIKTKACNKTFDEGFEQFVMEHIRLKNLRESTEKHYREIVKYSFYKFYDKDTLLEELEQKDIDDYIFWLQEKEIKDSTINIHLKGLKTIIRFFVSKGWIDSSIKVSLIKANIEDVEAYTDDEIEVLLKKPNMKQCTFAEYRNWVIVNFFCNTGCRRMTLINIFIEDLDLENGYCKFRHTKNRKPLTVPITPTMCTILKEYIECLPHDCRLLFPNILGQQLKPRGLTKALEDYNHSRGIKRTGIHKFRHWFAKKSVLLGVNLVQLQHILGHSNLEILKNYVTLLTRDLKYQDISLNPLENLKIQNRKLKSIKLRGK